MYKDNQIVQFRREYPMQISKVLSDIDYNMDYLESELEIFEKKGIRAAIFMIKKKEWQDDRIVLMRMVYDDDAHIEKYIGDLKMYSMKDYVDKKGKSVLADKFCWQCRKRMVRSV